MKTLVGDWIQTYTGKRVYPLNLTADQIDIKDIAHSLSLTCRFNGHVKKFYSVAQHCVLMSSLVDEEFQFAALMHDACEAYTSDIPFPIKPSVIITRQSPLWDTSWDDWEDTILKVIFDKYDIPFEHLSAIKNADRRLCTTEEIALFDSISERELELWPPYEDEVIIPWGPEAAEKLFLYRFKDLNVPFQS